MSPTQFRNYQEVSPSISKRHMLIIIPQHLYADVILTHLSEGTVKLAVILLYKRLFSTRAFRRAANVLIVFIVGWILAATFVSLTPNVYRLHLTSNRPRSSPLGR